MAESGSLRLQRHEIIINANSTSRVYGAAQLNSILDTTRSSEPHSGQFTQEQVPRSYHRDVTQDRATAVHGDLGDGVTIHRVKTVHTNHHNHSSSEPSTSAVKPAFLSPEFNDRLDAPSAVPNVVERSDILTGILNAFAEVEYVALVGAPGTGKSEVAINYCEIEHRASPETYIFWIDASSARSFYRSYERIADTLALPGYDNPSYDQITLVFKWLTSIRNKRKWFLVIDNVRSDSPLLDANPKDVNARRFANFLPYRKGCKTLLTTSYPRLLRTLWSSDSSEHRRVTVGMMLRGQSIRLFNNMLNQVQQIDITDEIIDDFVERLGDCPMAIRQAAMWIGYDIVLGCWQQSISKSRLDEYIRRVNENPSEMLDSQYRQTNTRRDRRGVTDDRMKSAPYDLYVTWQLTIQLLYTSEFAIHLFYLLCFLDRHYISPQLLAALIPDQDHRTHAVAFLKQCGILYAVVGVTGQEALAFRSTAQIGGLAYVYRNGREAEIEHLHVELLEKICEYVTMQHGSKGRREYILSGMQRFWWIPSPDSSANMHKIVAYKFKVSSPAYGRLQHYYSDYCLAQGLETEATRATLSRRKALDYCVKEFDQDFYFDDMLRSFYSCRVDRDELHELYRVSIDRTYTELFEIEGTHLLRNSIRAMNTGRMRYGRAFWRRGCYANAATKFGAVKESIMPTSLKEPDNPEIFRHLSEVASFYLDRRNFVEALKLFGHFDTCMGLNQRKMPEYYVNKCHRAMCLFLQASERANEVALAEEHHGLLQAFTEIKTVLGPFHVMTLLCIEEMFMVTDIWLPKLQVFRPRSTLSTVQPIWNTSVKEVSVLAVWTHLELALGWNHFYTLRANVHFHENLIADQVQTQEQTGATDPSVMDDLDYTDMLLTEVEDVVGRDHILYFRALHCFQTYQVLVGEAEALQTATLGLQDAESADEEMAL